jgi:hypothetical protein
MMSDFRSTLLTLKYPPVQQEYRELPEPVLLGLIEATSGRLLCGRLRCHHGSGRAGYDQYDLTAEVSHFFLDAGRIQYVQFDSNLLCDRRDSPIRDLLKLLWCKPEDGSRSTGSGPYLVKS